MPTYKTEGVVLKRSNYGEADRILTIYTRHHGKIKAIAKGVRKITSRKGGNLELFNHCTLFLAQGRNLDIVTEVQLLNSFPRLDQNLAKTAEAFYIVELVDKLTPEGQVNRQVFASLLAALDGRASTDEFEVELLRLLGFWSDKIDTIDVRGYIEEVVERRLKSADFREHLRYVQR